ncbi:MAG: hypothetical protein R2695_03345 [Acidimicrobiales bacterium]
MTTSRNPEGPSGSGSPANRQRKVASWARVLDASGENVVDVVPVVIPWAVIHCTGS